MTVPPSKAGGRLLGELVDLIDALIEEWYPGLLIVSPITGQPAVEIRVPCISCESELLYYIKTCSMIYKVFATTHCL